MTNRLLRRLEVEAIIGESNDPVHAGATPARVYLSRRGCWLGRHVPGAPARPATGGWREVLDREGERARPAIRRRL